MRTIRMTIDLTYDDAVWHGDDEESTAWFKKLLWGDDLQLGDFGEAGDTIGTVKVLEIVKGEQDE